MTQPLRIGVIGAGGIATLGHIPGLQKIPDVKVVAICDTRIDRAIAAARQFGIEHALATHDELLALGLDAVTIAAPNAFHAPIACAALAAGAHVLCEKPLATTVADGEAMVAAAQRAGRLLALNMHMRANPEMVFVRREIEQGRLGNIRYANARWFRRNGIPGYGSWFTRRELSGGGALMDIGVHMLDLLLWLVRPTPVTAVSAALHAVHGPQGRGLGTWGVDKVEGGIFDVEDFASVHLRLAGGGLLTVEVSWAIHGREELRVQLAGDAGGADVCADLYGKEKPVRLYRDEAGMTVEIAPTVERPPGSDWDRLIANFITAIRKGTLPLCTMEEGLTTLRLLDAACRSAREGREIAI